MSLTLDITQETSELTDVTTETIQREVTREKMGGREGQEQWLWVTTTSKRKASGVGTGRGEQTEKQLKITWIWPKYKFIDPKGLMNSREDEHKENHTEEHHQTT